MKFVFFAVDCPPFHAKTLEERPIGGTATGVIRLSEILHSLGHEVFVVTSFDNPPSFQGPKYIDINQAQNLEPVDVLIVIRGWARVFYPPFIRSKKSFFWTGDSYDSFLTVGIGDRRVINHYDGLFPVSNWHAETLCKSSGFPLMKTWILRNGIHLPYFSGQEIRKRKRLIYTSLPHRGLVLLPHIIKELKKKHPTLELHVFGSFDRNVPLWQPGIRMDPYFESTLSDLRSIEGCFFHGSISQKELAREFMKSSILAYPCNFEETSCITAMEAQAAGCPIVTSDIGALKETVGEAGILIKEKPGSEEYFHQYIARTDELLTNDALLQKLSKIGQERAQKFSWEKTAESLLTYLKIYHADI